MECSSRGAPAPLPAFLDFLDEATAIAPLALCPELRVHAACDLPSLWAALEAHLGRLGSAAPYWGIPWPGGQALARFVLDDPQLVRGRTVLDLGCGSGVCAIAAAKAGAALTIAADIDAFAGWATLANAALNAARVEVVTRDVIGEPPAWEVVLAGDLWYDRFLATRVTPWLRSLARDGCVVLLGDVGRAHFPRAGLVEQAVYEVATPEALERSAVIAARVWQFTRADAAAG